MEGTNKEKIDRILEYYQSTGLSLERCIMIVEPDIKLDVLKKVFIQKGGHKLGKNII